MMTSVCDMIENIVGKGENAGQMIISDFDRVENIVEREKCWLPAFSNAGYQHFLLFQHCFQKPSYAWSIN